MADKMWAVYERVTMQDIDESKDYLVGKWNPGVSSPFHIRQVVVLPVEEYDGMVATNNMNVRELQAMRQARQTFQTHSFD